MRARHLGVPPAKTFPSSLLNIINLVMPQIIQANRLTDSVFQPSTRVLEATPTCDLEHNCTRRPQGRGPLLAMWPSTAWLCSSISYKSHAPGHGFPLGQVDPWTHGPIKGGDVVRWNWNSTIDGFAATVCSETTLKYIALSLYKNLIT